MESKLRTLKRLVSNATLYSITQVTTPCTSEHTAAALYAICANWDSKRMKNFGIIKRDSTRQVTHVHLYAQSLIVEQVSRDRSTWRAICCTDTQVSAFIFTDNDLFSKFVRSQTSGSSSVATVTWNSDSAVNSTFIWGQLSNNISVALTLLMVFSHHRIHMNVKPFSCWQCNHHCKTSSNLRQHMSLVHNETSIYICKSCNQTFKYSTDLTQHKKEHSPSTTVYEIVEMSWGDE